MFRRAKNTDLLSTKVEGRYRKSVRGVILQFLRGMLTLVIAMVLARTIQPSDFGVVASLAPIVALVLVLKDLGLSTAIVQAKEINTQEVATYFWLQVGLGLLFGLLVAGFGPAYAYLVDDQRMILLGPAMGAVVFFQVLGSVHAALLRRNLLFTELTVLECASLLSGLSAAIVLVVAGGGYWCLIAQQLTQAMVLSVGLWLISNWRPHFDLLPIRQLQGLKLGGSLTIGSLCQYVRRNADIFLIKKFYGDEQLGYYSRGYRIILMPTTQFMAPVSAVAIPLLSKERDGSNYGKIFGQIFEFCIVVAVPVGVFTFVSPEAVIHIGFGPNWIESLPIIRALGLLAIVLPIGNCLALNLIVFGRTKEILTISILALLLSLVAFGVGIQQSVATLASYYAYSMAGVLCIYAVVVSRITKIPLTTFLKIATLPLIAMVVASIAAHWIAPQFPLEPLFQSLLNFAIFSVAYLALLLFVFGYLKKLKALKSQFFDKPSTD